MDAIPNVIIALTAVAGVVLGIISLNRDSQQEKRCGEWERDQEQKRQEWERRQQDAEAPHLKPVGAAWHGLTDAPLVRLTADVQQQDIELHNVGKSTPVEVAGVLFGARVMTPQSRKRTDTCTETIGLGILVSRLLRTGACTCLLDNQRYPLKGEQSVIDGLTLFAPDEPILGVPQADPNLFARLTMTYRDAYGRTLALVYDARAVLPDGSKIEWQLAAGPTEVSKSLQALIDETNRDRIQAQTRF